MAVRRHDDMTWLPPYAVLIQIVVRESCPCCCCYLHAAILGFKVNLNFSCFWRVLVSFVHVSVAGSLVPVVITSVKHTVTYVKECSVKLAAGG